MTAIANSRKRDLVQNKRGFTLVELLISIAIIVTLSIALYVQQSRFDSSIFINNTAQSIALSIREAQTFGRGALVGTGDSSPSVHGIQLSRNSKDVIVFRDINENGRYDTGSDQEIRRYTLTDQNAISSLTLGGTGHSCLSITFKKPSPEPIFNNCSSGLSVATAVITLLNTTDNVARFITVSPTGQIQVSE